MNPTAAWIASQLTDDVVESGGVVDWGLTIDALLGLIAAGTQADQVANTAAKLYASDTVFIGSDQDQATKWPAIAKMALALQAAGLDPTGFPTTSGPRDLVSDLESVLNLDGSFGASGVDSVFTHALAVLALSRSGDPVPAIAVTWMLQQQCGDTTSVDFGSFGWAPDCSAPDTDTTALAVQALVAAGADASEALAWLLTQQDASGGFESWGALNSNSTGLVVQTIRGTHPQIAAQGTDYILGLQVNCDIAAADGPLGMADVGAIGYDHDSFDQARAQGLDPGLASQFLRASVQAIFGLGGPGLAELSTEGAYNSTSPMCVWDKFPDPPTVETGGSGAPSTAALALAFIMLGGLAVVVARKLSVAL